MDIGSNTTRLLVADCGPAGLAVLELTREFTRIGSALGDDSVVPVEKVAEVAELVSRNVSRAREMGAERCAIVATAALRDARNRDEVLAAVSAACGLEVRLLAEEEEARLTFEGAARTLPEAPDGPLAVVDVGGRSTEVAVGSLPADAIWAQSFRLGSGLLADRHLHSDPPAPAEIESVRAHAREALAGLKPPRSVRAVACGGSAGSLRRITGDELHPDALDRALALLAGAPAAEVASLFALDAQRVRLLPAGVLILQAVSERLGMPLEVVDGGLREGVLFEMAAEKGGG